MARWELVSVVDNHANSFTDVRHDAADLIHRWSSWLAVEFWQVEHITRLPRMLVQQFDERRRRRDQLVLSVFLLTSRNLQDHATTITNNLKGVGYMICCLVAPAQEMTLNENLAAAS